MSLPLAYAQRKLIHQALGEGLKETGAVITFLTTPNYVIDIFK